MLEMATPQTCASAWKVETGRERGGGITRAADAPEGREGGSAARTEEVLASGVVGDGIGDVEIGGDGQQ